MVQLWRICAVFFLFFGLFWIAYALNQTGSFAGALYRPTMVCSWSIYLNLLMGSDAKMWQQVSFHAC